MGTNWFGLGRALLLTLPLTAACSPDDGNGGAQDNDAGAGGTFSNGGTGGTNNVGGQHAGGHTNGPPCRPAVVSPADNPNAKLLVKLEKLPNALGDPTFGGVALAGDSVYYSSSAGIHRLPKAGGTPESVLANESVGKIFIDADKIYFHSVNVLYSVPLAAVNGTAMKVVDLELDRGGVLAVNSGRAYSWLPATQKLQMTNVSSGTTTTLLEPAPPRITFAGDFIYFADSNDYIWRVAKAGGTPERVSQGGSITWSVGVDGDTLYYGSYNSIFQIAEPSNKKLLSIDAHEYIDRVEPLGDRLLFEGDDSVGWVSKDGLTCGKVSQSFFGPDGWDHDDKNFFVGVDGSLYRIPI